MAVPSHNASIILSSTPPRSYLTPVSQNETFKKIPRRWYDNNTDMSKLPVKKLMYNYAIKNNVG